MPKSKQINNVFEIDRENILEDSYSYLSRLPVSKLHNKFVVTFKGEKGQDEGGILREWYQILSHEILNPDYALFILSSTSHAYRINPSSHVNDHHLSYFKRSFLTAVSPVPFTSTY